MRITQRMMTERAVNALNENQERVMEYRDRVATQKAFNYVSDNPSAASASLTLRSTLRMTQAYRSTAQTAEDWMAATEFSLKQVVELATRATTLAQQGLSTTMGAHERQHILATELRSTLQNAVQLANSSHQGSYLFGGHKITTSGDAPFELTGLDVVTHGDTGQLTREISPKQTITINADGQATFTGLFTAIKNAITSLEGGDLNGLAKAVQDLTTAAGTVTESRTVIGARQRQLRAALERMDKTEVEVKSLLSQKEDVNLAEAIAALQNQETVYQASLQVGQRAISALNLFDYLR